MDHFDLVHKIHIRNYEECDIAESVITPQNTEYVSHIITVMETLTEQISNKENEKSEELLVAAFEIYETDHKKELGIVEEAIRLALPNSETLETALMHKALLLSEAHLFEEARHIYEIALDYATIKEHKFTIVRCHLYLGRCYINLKCDDRAQVHCKEAETKFKMYKAEFAAKKKLSQSSNVSNRTSKEKLNLIEIQQMSNIEFEIALVEDKLKDNLLDWSDYHVLPSLCSNKTSVTSRRNYLNDVCETKDDGSIKIKMNLSLKKNVELMSEQPFITDILIPHIQCFKCLKFVKYLIPCFGCKCVHYCSKICHDEDYVLHKYECAGYSCGFFPVFKMTLVYRLLTIALNSMKKDFFGNKRVKKCQSAKVLFDLVCDLSKNKRDDCYLILRMSPKYDELDEKHFFFMISNAIRLQVYLMRDVGFISNYFLDLKRLNTRDIEVFLVSLIMRYSNHVYKYMKTLEYAVPNLDLPEFHLNNKNDFFSTNIDNMLLRLFFNCNRDDELEVVSLGKNENIAQEYMWEFISVNNVMTKIEESERVDKIKEKFQNTNKAREYVMKCVVQSFDPKKNILDSKIIAILNKYLQTRNTNAITPDVIYKQNLSALYSNIEFYPRDVRPNAATKMEFTGMLSVYSIVDIFEGCIISISDNNCKLQWLNDCGSSTCVNSSLTSYLNIRICYNCGSKVLHSLKCFVCYKDLTNFAVLVYYIVQFQYKFVNGNSSTSECTNIITLAFDILAPFYDPKHYIFFHNRLCYLKVQVISTKYKIRYSDDVIGENLDNQLLNVLKIYDLCINMISKHAGTIYVLLDYINIIELGIELLDCFSNYGYCCGSKTKYTTIVFFQLISALITHTMNISDLMNHCNISEQLRQKLIILDKVEIDLLRTIEVMYDNDLISYPVVESSFFINNFNTPSSLLTKIFETWENYEDKPKSSNSLDYDLCLDLEVSDNSSVITIVESRDIVDDITRNIITEQVPSEVLKPITNLKKNKCKKRKKKLKNKSKTSDTDVKILESKIEPSKASEANDKPAESIIDPSKAPEGDDKPAESKIDPSKISEADDELAESKIKLSKASAADVKFAESQIEPSKAPEGDDKPAESKIDPSKISEADDELAESKIKLSKASAADVKFAESQIEPSKISKADGKLSESKIESSQVPEGVDKFAESKIESSKSPDANVIFVETKDNTDQQEKQADVAKDKQMPINTDNSHKWNYIATVKYIRKHFHNAYKILNNRTNFRSLKQKNPSCTKSDNTVLEDDSISDTTSLDNNTDAQMLTGENSPPQDAEISNIDDDIQSNKNSNQLAPELCTDKSMLPSIDNASVPKIRKRADNFATYSNTVKVQKYAKTFVDKSTQTSAFPLNRINSHSYGPRKRQTRESDQYSQKEYNNLRKPNQYSEYGGGESKNNYHDQNKYNKKSSDHYYSPKYNKSRNTSYNDYNWSNRQTGRNMRSEASDYAENGRYSNNNRPTDCSRMW